MARSLLLKIITPETLVYQERVDFVSLMGMEGSFGVLPGHAPLITQLQVATGFIEREGKRIPVAIMGGMCKVLDQHMTIMTDAAELGQNIDVLRAQEKKRSIEVLLQEPNQDRQMQVDGEMRLKKALVRLRTAELVKRL